MHIKSDHRNLMSILYMLIKQQWSRQESNLDLELRKLSYYPLYYETKSSLYQTAHIGSEYLYGNGEQNYAKKLSHC